MFTVTVQYFGSINIWTHTFTKPENVYSFLDAVRPFICYSKVTDDQNMLSIVKNYAHPGDEGETLFVNEEGE
mgnify:CR=1 FL=1